MFSWLVLLTMMATIAFYLLFPREDLVNLQDKPMDDVDAKRILVLHQAMVDLAKTHCPNQGDALLYTLLDGNAVQCSATLNNVQIVPNANVGGAVDLLLRSHIASRLFRNRSLRGTPQDPFALDTRISCLNADTGVVNATCNPADPALAGAPLAAFVVTYANLPTHPTRYTENTPMLPYMLGKAFDFHYTGEPVVIRPNAVPVAAGGAQTSSALQLNTYCGRVVNHETPQYPRPLRAVQSIPFVAPGGAIANDITNTRYHIATLPAALNIGNNTDNWVVCVTPLNQFDGQALTTKIYY